MIISNSFRATLLAMGLFLSSLAPAASAQKTGDLWLTDSQEWADASADTAQSAGQAQSPPPSSAAPQSSTPATPKPQPSSSSQAPNLSNREKAAQQVKSEEKQRVLGVVPNFNVTYLGEETVPLSVGQKFNLALHTSIDPFMFFAAGADAAYSQATNAFPGYGQGWAGYGKRLGASYADTVDGTILGNALLPALLRQDPRYYRMGRGTFTHRLLYSISTTVWCKNDNGKWGPNYSNVLGNLAAGGISNLYYPSTDRGAALSIERGFTVTAEGTIGGFFDEFWPDIAHKVFKKHLTQFQPNLPPQPTSGQQAPALPH